MAGRDKGEETMKVKCIDTSTNYLMVGKVYEVDRVQGDFYFLHGIPGSWFTRRFVVVPDNACEQCGEVHPEVKK